MSNKIVCVQIDRTEHVRQIKQTTAPEVEALHFWAGRTEHVTYLTHPAVVTPRYHVSNKKTRFKAALIQLLEQFVPSMFLPAAARFIIPGSEIMQPSSYDSSASVMRVRQATRQLCDERLRSFVIQKLCEVFRMDAKVRKKCDPLRDEHVAQRTRIQERSEIDECCGSAVFEYPL
jgi:hypothetical protein